MKGTPPSQLAMVCATCPRKRDYEPSPWFAHINHLYNLVRAGYPFGPDDLSLEEWTDIGILRDHYEAMMAGMKRG